MNANTQDMNNRRAITGSVQLRHGRWYVVLNLYDREGNRRPKWINTELPERGNKRKAEKLKEEYIVQYEEQATVIDKDLLMDRYSLSWLNNKTGLELSTWENYENVVKNHIVPYFKKKKMMIGDISPKHIRDYYNYKLSGGRKDKKKGGLSRETMKKHKSVLYLIFEDAIEIEAASRNPAAKVSIPKPDVEDKADSLDKAVFLTADEANRVLALFEEDYLQPLLYVTLNYGLRRSEVVGLKWGAIDFENDFVEINHTVVKHKTIVEKDRTKSKASHGKMELLPDVKEILLELKARQEEYRKEFGSLYEDNDYIFKWPNGRKFRPDYVTKRFQAVLEKAGFPHMKFHHLRHSCASILFEKGWNVKDIQGWLRHSKLETTMDIYTHISEQHKKILANDMDGTFRQCKVSGLNKNQHPGARKPKANRQNFKKAQTPPAASPAGSVPEQPVMPL